MNGGDVALFLGGCVGHGGAAWRGGGERRSCIQFYGSRAGIADGRTAILLRGLGQGPAQLFHAIVRAFTPTTLEDQSTQPLDGKTACLRQTITTYDVDTAPPLLIDLTRNLPETLTAGWFSQASTLNLAPRGQLKDPLGYRAMYPRL